MASWAAARDRGLRGGAAGRRGSRGAEDGARHRAGRLPRGDARAPTESSRAPATTGSPRSTTAAPTASRAAPGETSSPPTLATGSKATASSSVAVSIATGTRTPRASTNPRSSRTRRQSADDGRGVPGRTQPHRRRREHRLLDLAGRRPHLAGGHAAGADCAHAAARAVGAGERPGRRLRRRTRRLAREHARDRGRCDAADDPSLDRRPLVERPDRRGAGAKRRTSPTTRTG